MKFLKQRKKCEACKAAEYGGKKKTEYSLLSHGAFEKIFHEERYEKRKLVLSSPAYFPVADFGKKGKNTSVLDSVSLIRFSKSRKVKRVERSIFILIFQYIKAFLMEILEKRKTKMGDSPPQGFGLLPVYFVKIPKGKQPTREKPVFAKLYRMERVERSVFILIFQAYQYLSV